jgi:hypothetical protein
MAQAAFVEDVLPPEGVYESRESLLTAINSWAKPRGYAFTTGKSTKTPRERIKVVYACDRNKQPPSASIERVRHTSSRRTGCKFSVLAKQSLDRSAWVLSYRPDKECARHNHPPSEDPSAYLAHRRFEEQDAVTISNLAMSSTTPRDIRTTSILTQRPSQPNETYIIGSQRRGEICVKVRAASKHQLINCTEKVSGAEFDWPNSLLRPVTGDG